MRRDLTGILFFLVIGSHVAELIAAPPEVSVEAKARLDAAITVAVNKVQVPGGVLWLERDGRSYTRAYGKRSIVPTSLPMTTDTIFDVASLTKVVATAPSILLLAERGELSIDDKVGEHIPEFSGGAKDKVTLKHLLTHTSGLRPIIEREPAWTGVPHAIELAVSYDLFDKPGRRFRYSDINYIFLGEIVRRVSGQRLDQFAAANLFVPLGMADTRFLPPTSKHWRIAPTEKVKGTVLRGVVHDPCARSMGGVAGHAGLFSTARDLAAYARMIANGGRHRDRQILKPDTVKLMTRNHVSVLLRAKRGLGWDIDTPFSHPRGDHFSKRSTFGHTGWTGVSIWIDPPNKAFVLFLANRNHPYERKSIRKLRHEIGTLAAEAMGL